MPLKSCAKNREMKCR